MSQLVDDVSDCRSKAASVEDGKDEREKQNKHRIGGMGRFMSAFSQVIAKEAVNLEVLGPRTRMYRVPLTALPCPSCNKTTPTLSMTDGREILTLLQPIAQSVGLFVELDSNFTIGLSGSDVQPAVPKGAERDAEVVGNWRPTVTLFSAPRPQVTLLVANFDICRYGFRASAKIFTGNRFLWGLDPTAVTPLNKGAQNSNKVTCQPASELRALMQELVVVMTVRRRARVLLQRVGTEFLEGASLAHCQVVAGEAAMFRPRNAAGGVQDLLMALNEWDSTCCSLSDPSSRRC